MPARPRLNLFSPLPPQHSEIGNHTLTVAAALSERADVTLWSAQPEPPVLRTAGGLRLDLPVVRFDPAQLDLPRLHQADAQVYNIGNNAAFHRSIFEVARRVPGIVVLHDTRLQHFFAAQAETEGAPRDSYLHAMRRFHGAAAADDARRWMEGEAALDLLVAQYPMTVAAADGALAAVVHNREERRRLAGECRTPVFYLPLAHEARPLPPRSDAGPTGASTLRLVVFGFLGLNRRLATLLDVVGSMAAVDIQLDIFGKADDPAAVEAQIARLGLQRQVQLHGFVPEAELRVALARADLAVNLRYPSMGEASASQLRIWEAALPALVTRTGWYATLPEDTVFFVEPEREAETLRGHLEDWCRNPAAFRQAGQRGRTLLEAEHTPAGYADGLLQVVAQVDALHARRAAIDLSRRAARAMMELAGPGGAALGTDPVAAAIAALGGAPPPS